MNDVLRVFHVPSHLAYAQALQARSFGPVPSPTGQPLTVGQLVAQPDWRFLDVLHLHSVELASREDVEALLRLLNKRGAPLVVTVHDLEPNIESDREAHSAKLVAALEHAGAVLTLTEPAAVQVRRWRPRGVHVTPHGAGLPVALVQAQPRETRTVFAVYGALRPNRDVLAVVRAWRLLDPVSRPPLRVLLRSVGPADRDRDRHTLEALRSVASYEPDLDVQVRNEFLRATELRQWLEPARVLVLPYRWVTHSGQLEVGCDLGIPVVAPDVRTLRAQLDVNGASWQPAVWYPVGELASPVRLATRLEAAVRLPTAPEAKRQSFLRGRLAERHHALELHRRIYTSLARGGTTRLQHHGS